VTIVLDIANWWLSQGRPEAREDWETDAQLFLQSETGLRELVWIDTKGETLWSVHPGAVPDFKRHSPDAELAVTVRQARQNGTLTLSNVANRNGVPHFYACAPIRSGRLVGFVAGLFDAAALAGSLLGQQVPRDYQVTDAVWITVGCSIKRASFGTWRRTNPLRPCTAFEGSEPLTFREGVLKWGFRRSATIRLRPGIHFSGNAVSRPLAVVSSEGPAPP
jgi:hypothetical protein